MINALVLFYLFSGRWGAHLTVGPFFVGDAVLLAAILSTLARAATQRGRFVVPIGPGAGACLALLAWSTARLLAGAQLDFDSLRDWAPYAYAGLVLLVATRHVNRQERISTRWLWPILLMHLALVALVVIWPSAIEPLPSIGPASVKMASLRADFDAAVLAVTAAIGMRRALTGSRRRAGAAAVVLASAALVMALGSRAGLIALLVAVAMAAAHVYRRQDWRRRRSLGVLALGPMTLALLITLTPIDLVSRQVIHVGETMGAATRQDAQWSENPEIREAAGTARARREVWSRIISHTLGSPSRAIFGSGFGTNVLATSGASQYLEGAVHRDVRAPHNFMLNTLMRLGLVGVTLLVWLTVRLLSLVCRALADPQLGVHAFAAACLAAVLLVTSAFGVILESPFGAIPFFWSMAVLALWAREEARTGERTSPAGV